MGSRFAHRPRACGDGSSDDQDRGARRGQGTRGVRASIKRCRRAARHHALHDDDADGAGISCHSGAGAHPPLSLRSESPRRGAAGLVARERGSARLPHLRLGRGRRASALLPGPLSRGDRCSGAARDPDSAHGRQRRAGARRARGGGLERPCGDLGPARRRRATRRRDRLPRRLREHTRSARPPGAAGRSPLLSNDQWANGEAIARAGVGITVADDASERKVLDLPGSTTIAELPGAVTSILEDATYRREAGRVAAAMRALPSVDESVRFIEEIAGSS